MQIVVINVCDGSALGIADEVVGPVLEIRFTDDGIRDFLGHYATSNTLTMTPACKLVSGFGDWIALMALFSMVAFGRRGTPAQVSGILLAFVVPVALIGPLAGVFVDRSDLKRTMIASDLVRAALSAALVAASTLPQVYALVFALSAVSCFFIPAQTAAIPLLLGGEELLVANALNAQAVNLNRVDATANGKLAYALEAALKNSPMFDPKETKLSGPITYSAENDETFTFGVVLKLKRPMTWSTFRGVRG